MTSILIVGAGSVGVNLAILLKEMGYAVEILESDADILRGAAQVSFVNHGDGFEYYTKDHRATGEFCVEGSLTKALMYPLHFLSTDICTAEDPLRFMVSEAAVAAGEIEVKQFTDNARHMMNHYRCFYDELGDAAGFSADERENVFVRHPDKFMRLLAPNDYADVTGIAAGAYGNGFGINMPHYYAVEKAVLRSLDITPRFNSHIRSIERVSDRYEVRTDDSVYVADHVMLCCGHHIPRLAAQIQGVNAITNFAGTYFLNSMTFLELLPTSDAAILASANRINFTLKDQYGGMFACIVPPTTTTAGSAAIYLPAPEGSQILSQTSSEGSRPELPPEWDRLVAEGLPSSDAHVRSTMCEISKLYPFLDGHARILNTACRTVFNVATEASQCGIVRSVREQSFENHALTEDARVTAWAAPKWTNAEFTALIALDFILGQTGQDQLNLSKNTRAKQLGQFFRDHHFRDVKALVSDAENYCKTSPAPLSERMIARRAAQFQAAT